MKCWPMNNIVSASLANQKLDADLPCMSQGGVRWLISSEENTVLLFKVSSFECV